MTGRPVSAKCLLACLFFESPQQPVLPQIMHTRRGTQLSPVFRHSSQPDVLAPGHVCIRTEAAMVAARRGLVHLA